MLINAVKDVATALGDLIQATKAASGKNISDPSMNDLKESAKVNWSNENDYETNALGSVLKNGRYTFSLLNFRRLW